MHKADLTRHVVIFNYSVAYLVIFAVSGFLIALGTLVGVGCTMNDEMCNDPADSTMSEIVDQPTLYPWFAVFSTLFVLLLLLLVDLLLLSSAAPENAHHAQRAPPAGMHVRQLQNAIRKYRTGQVHRAFTEGSQQYVQPAAHGPPPRLG